MPATHRLERLQRIDRPLEEVFEFFSKASNLETLTPAFLGFRILTSEPIEMRVGARIDYALSLFRVPLRWRTRITVWQPGIRFVDEQESGPFELWRHLHEFEAFGDTVLMRDVVDYALPFGPLGSLARVCFVRKLLDGIFDHRRAAISELFGLSETNAAVAPEGFAHVRQLS